MDFIAFKVDFILAFFIVGLLATTLVGIGVSAWYIRYEIGKSGIHKVIRNQFIILISLINILLTIANLLFMFSWSVKFGDQKKEFLVKMVILEPFQASFYNSSVGLHIWGLYLRTDSTIIPIKMRMVVKIFLHVFVLGGLINAFPMNLFGSTHETLYLK